MKLNIVSIDCVCGAMLYPPPETSDVGEEYYVEELILSVEVAESKVVITPDDVVQRRVSELSDKAADVKTETTTETVTVETPDGPIQITITKVKITARRYMAELKPDGLYCPKCGRKVFDIT
jgi:hypothetical protein